MSNNIPAELDAFYKELVGYLQEDFFDNFHKKCVSMMGVCCFTKNLISELMWSHYAASTSGVCLEFGFKQNSKILSRLVAVRYSDKSIIVNKENDRFKVFFHKRSAWAWEKEWRILNEFGYRPFEKNDLESIIFGPRTTEANQQLIRSQR